MPIYFEEFHGRAREVSISSDLTVDFNRARLWLINATVAALNVNMPDATTFKRGGPTGIIVLVAASNAVTIRDNGGTNITLSNGTATLSADECAKMLLLENSDADGTWHGKVASVSSAGNPTPTALAYIVGGAADQTLNEEYDHQLDSISTVAVILENCRQGGCFRHGSTGTWVGSDAAPQDKVTRYTASADSWAAQGDKPAAFTQGQSSRGGPGAARGQLLGTASFNRDETEEYTVSGDSWASVSDKTTPCINGTGCVDPADVDAVFVQNGDDTGGGSAGTTHEKFKSSTDAWSSVQNQNSPATINHCATGYAGSLVKVGGSNSTPEDVDVYGISGDSWVAKTDFPAASPSNLNRNRAAMAAPEDLPHLFGGSQSTTLQDDIYRYTPGLDTWTAKITLSANRSSFPEQATPLTP